MLDILPAKKKNKRKYKELKMKNVKKNIENVWLRLNMMALRWRKSTITAENIFFVC